MSETVLVTGANRGIGLELVRQLAATGHRVIATARAPGKATELQALHDGSGDVRIEVLDVGSRESAAALSEHLAGEPIDTLINNAGVGGHIRSLVDAELDSYRHCFEINSLGPLRTSLAILDNLRAGSRKRIVNISSQLGSMARNTAGGYHPYRVSKAALNMLTRSMAAELGREGFTCVSFHPGWVRTDMGGAQAPLSPVESASGMLQVVERLSTRDNGAFFDYTGEAMPW